MRRMNKNTAEVVIIGGGVTGCSIAYNLAHQGCRDVVILEKSYLASGSTGRCGAGIRQQWGTEMNCILSRESVKLFEEMNDTLNVKRDIEFKQKGYLLLAYSEREMNQFEKNLALQNSLVIPSRRVSMDEIRKIVSYLNLEGVKGATFCPTDGHANPFRVTQAYAGEAVRLGAKIYTETEVLDIKTRGGKIQGVETDRGFISTENVVNAAGGYAFAVSSMAGIKLPVKSERHEILVTEPVEPLLDPMVMSFSYNIYCQQTPEGTFIMGYGPEDAPESFSIRSSRYFLRKMASKVTSLLPVLSNLRVVRQWAGLYNITPDNQPILGEVPGLDGFYLAVGFSGHGFMIAPMVGILMAEMILGKDLSMEHKLDLGRFERGELILEPSVV